MKRLTTIILLTTWTTISFTTVINPADKLKIGINKNVELLGLAYFIGFEGDGIETKTVEIGGKKIPKKDWHNYGFYIYEKYKSFRTSENLGKSFSVADHLWLDYLIDLLIQVENAPNARLKETIDQSYYINFSKKKDLQEARQNVTVFLDGLNGFCKEIDFDNYLLETKKYYEKVIDEIRNNLPTQDFIGAMETFYKSRFDSYSLIPSLTIPKGMGFGMKYTSDNKTHVFNVFGALDFQEFLNTDELKMGFANESKLRELSIHEFGHSFVNPVVGKLPEDKFLQTEKLFESLKSAMDKQGYNTWKVCVYEHFVRAGEILIAEKLGDMEGVKKLQAEYEQDRQFKYIPVILTELRKYDKRIYATYYDTVIKSMDELIKK